MESGRIIFDDCKKAFICKACDKSWYGESKKRTFTQHCESQTHRTMINAIKVSGKDNKYINNNICYEEYDFGFENKLKVGYLDED